MNRIIPVVAISLLLALAEATPLAAADRGAPDDVGCPTSRAHIEPDLHTLPEDGSLYESQREALHMPIDEVLRGMGGVSNAYAIAAATRARAAQALDEGVTGAERRYWLDTILRADALVEILDCLAAQEAA